MRPNFSDIEEAVEAIAAGRIVIVLDSEDREDEGDFVLAAEAVTAELIHFMISEGRGQLCLPVVPEIAERLQLTLMVSHTRGDGAPRFAIPVDHVTCRTGISPWERAYTIRQMLDPHSRPDDFIRPGHIFPLIAQPGGVLQRTGHTEAAVDLARLAGLTPAGILCEVCSRDRHNMASRDELLELGAAHRLPVITIDALVEYRAAGRTPPTRRVAEINSLDASPTAVCLPVGRS